MPKYFLLALSKKWIIGFWRVFLIVFCHTEPLLGISFSHFRQAKTFAQKKLKTSVFSGSNRGMQVITYENAANEKPHSDK